MKNFDLNFMNGVELTYCLDKYDRGTVTIEILNGETKLKLVDISLLGDEITENFKNSPHLKNIQFHDDESFEVYPTLPMDSNDHYGFISFEGGSIENYWFQDIESPLKEILIAKESGNDDESKILKGGAKLYYDIFWDAFNKEIWS
jgi:hypothetical protein